MTHRLGRIAEECRALLLVGVTGNNINILNTLNLTMSHRFSCIAEECRALLLVGVTADRTTSRPELHREALSWHVSGLRAIQQV
mgnify:CR=1 FL=1